MNQQFDDGKIAGSMEELPGRKASPGLRNIRSALDIRVFDLTATGWLLLLPFAAATVVIAVLLADPVEGLTSRLRGMPRYIETPVGVIAIVGIGAVTLVVAISLFRAAARLLETKLGITVIRKPSEAEKSAAELSSRLSYQGSFFQWPPTNIHSLMSIAFVTLVVGSLVALLIFDTRDWYLIGFFAGGAALLLLKIWLPEIMRQERVQEAWLAAARRLDPRTDNDQPDAYYLELGEERAETGELTPKRFLLGTCRERAEKLAPILVMIWENHEKQWTQQAFDEVAAAFRADPSELARISQMRNGTNAHDVRIHVEQI